MKNFPLCYKNTIEFLKKQRLFSVITQEPLKSSLKQEMFEIYKQISLAEGKVLQSWFERDILKPSSAVTEKLFSYFNSPDFPQEAKKIEKHDILWALEKLSGEEWHVETFETNLMRVQYRKEEKYYSLWGKADYIDVPYYIIAQGNIIVKKRFFEFYSSKQQSG